MRRLLSIACVLAVFPGAASAETFRGETSQGKRATVRTNDAGFPYDIHFAGFRGPCDRGKAVWRGAAGGFVAPFDRASTDAAVQRDDDAFGNHRLGVTTFGELRAERHGKTWAGHVFVRRRTQWEDRNGDRLTRTCTARFHFSAELEFEPLSTPAPVQVEVIRTDILRVVGSAAADDIRVTFDPASGLHVVSDPKGVELAAAPQCVPRTPTHVECAIAQPRVVVAADSGDDHIYVAAAGAVSVIINAGGGNDGVSTRVAASTVPVSIDGRAGIDVISGSDGADMLDGGTGGDDVTGYGGNDRLVGGGGRGPDALFGGAGDDELVMQDGRVDGTAYCGEGQDVAILDLREPVNACEEIERPTGPK